MSHEPCTIGELVFEGDIVRGPGQPVRELPPDPEAIRTHLRFDDAGRYRPLSGARGMPSGWFVRLEPGLTPDDVLEAAYPLAAVHRRQAAAGTLRVVPLEDVLRRQSGRYQETAALTTAGRALIRNELCGRCVRTPVWPLTLQPPTSNLPPSTSHLPPSAIPCPEPCSVLVALAREALAWEREPPEPSPVDPSVPFADFEQPGNEIREACIAAILNLPQG